MKWLVCGGRDFGDFSFLDKTLTLLMLFRGRPDLIIEGGAGGADYLARMWAQGDAIPVHTERADWQRFGKRAGPKRNRAMLRLKPDLVIAFAGNEGTADMVAIARHAGIEVLEPKEDAA